MIRPFDPADLPDVLAAWAAATAVAHPFLDDVFLAAERRSIAEVYLVAAETWVWERGGRAVGFISMLEDEIGGLFVAPECHRLGIGGALLDHVRRTRRAVEVEVFAANRLGRSFYAGRGFREVDADRSGHGGGVDLT